MLKCHLQSAGGRVGDFFAGEYVLCAAEETERACFGANFSSLQRVINGDSALRSKPLSLLVI
jgi:hypothetical protein